MYIVTQCVNNIACFCIIHYFIVQLFVQTIFTHNKYSLILVPIRLHYTVLSVVQSIYELCELASLNNTYVHHVFAIFLLRKEKILTVP